MQVEFKPVSCQNKNGLSGLFGLPKETARPADTAKAQRQTTTDDNPEKK